MCLRPGELQLNWVIFRTALIEKGQTEPSVWAVLLVWTHNHLDPCAPLACPELKRAMVICFAYISSDSKTVTAVPDPWHKSLFTKGCLAGQILNSTTSQASQRISYMALQTSWSTKHWKGLYIENNIGSNARGRDLAWIQPLAWTNWWLNIHICM